MYIENSETIMEFKYVEKLTQKNDAKQVYFCSIFIDWNQFVCPRLRHDWVRLPSFAPRLSSFEPQMNSIFKKIRSFEARMN